MDLASQFAVPVMWDSASASPWFEYVSGSARHTVWFENGSSVGAKLDVTRIHDIGGIAVWRLGGEDRQLVGGAGEIRGCITTAAGRHSSERVNHLANRRRVARQEAAN